MRTPSAASFSLAAVLAVALAAPVTSQATTFFPNEVAAGDVDTQSVVLWAATKHPGLVLFQIAGQPSFHWPVRWAFDFVPDAARPAKVAVNGLMPGHRYYYRAITYGRVSATGTFETANAPGGHHGLHFGVSGDWRGELSPYPAVTNADSSLDFFMTLGDTIYADYPTPAVPLPQATTLAQYRRKQREVYSERFGLAALADLRRQTAWFATIDDHEVINDFAGAAAPATDPRFLPSNATYISGTALYRNGLKAFLDYNPIVERKYHQTGDARFDGVPNLYRQRRFGDDAAFFLLDARSFRDAELPPVANLGDPAQVGAFLVASFDPTRTMLGSVQVARLQQDLLAAQQGGVTWKFVCVPEPIQNLGVVGASDRFEGYAAERAALLAFVGANGITNVVFVTADLHGTLVNNLTYNAGPGQPQIPTNTFEIITGSVAFDAPLGPTLVEIAGQAGLLTPQQVAFYQSLPTQARDAFVENLINGAIQPLGYDPLGLQGSPIAATLLAGSYTAAHTFGWSEFTIDAQSQALTVTTWGIEPYTEADLANPAAVLARVPQVVQQFVVQPQ